MSDEQGEEEAIRPKRQKIVEFYGDEIPAAQASDDEIYVPLRSLTTLLGLDPRGQQRRAENDPELADALKLVTMIGADGKQREQLCLPLEIIPGWLFGINPTRVKAKLREKLNRYRRECFKVLWNAFKGEIRPTLAPPTNLTPAEQILAQAEAIAALARQQVEIERQQQAMANFMRPFVQTTRHELAVHDQRINALELRLDPQSQITEEQASEIALAVKNVAYALGGGGQDYGKVYAELYRRYRVSSYKNLPRSRYDEALAWLG